MLRCEASDAYGPPHDEVGVLRGAEPERLGADLGEAGPLPEPAAPGVLLPDAQAHVFGSCAGRMLERGLEQARSDPPALALREDVQALDLDVIAAAGRSHVEL